MLNLIMKNVIIIIDLLIQRIFQDLINDKNLIFYMKIKQAK
jgi:hypothetical protein